MSSVLRPQGSKRATVYWRRRAMVLVLVVAIPLTLGYFALGAVRAAPSELAPPESTPTQSTAAQSNQPAASSSESDHTAPPVDPGTGNAAAAPASGAPAAAPPAPAACPDEAIAVAVVVDKNSYPADAKPRITLTITSTSEADCSRDIGSGANEIVITSGGSHVWSSNDCDPSSAANVAVLRPGDQAAAAITWERKFSAPGCAGEAAPAQPGTYEVTGSNGSVVAEPVRFVLE